MIQWQYVNDTNWDHKLNRKNITYDEIQTSYYYQNQKEDEFLRIDHQLGAIINKDDKNVMFLKYSGLSINHELLKLIYKN